MRCNRLIIDLSYASFAAALCHVRNGNCLRLTEDDGRQIVLDYPKNSCQVAEINVEPQDCGFLFGDLNHFRLR